MDKVHLLMEMFTKVVNGINLPAESDSPLMISLNGSLTNSLNKHGKGTYLEKNVQI